MLFLCARLFLLLKPFSSLSQSFLNLSQTPLSSSSLKAHALHAPFQASLYAPSFFSHDPLSAWVPYVLRRSFIRQSELLPRATGGKGYLFDLDFLAFGFLLSFSSLPPFVFCCSECSFCLRRARRSSICALSAPMSSALRQ